MRVAGRSRATFSPHVARVHPAKLVAGLAAAVERLGVEDLRAHAGQRDPPARGAAPRAGAVSARWVVRATEGYTASLPGLRRVLVPMNSSMIVTEPLAQRDVGGDRLGRAASCSATGRTCTSTCSAPRTVASRSAGAACPIASARAPTDAARPRAATIASLRAQAARDVPGRRRRARSSTPGRACSACPATGACRSTPIPRTGLAWAGGYVGEGVAAANLAGADAARPASSSRPSQLTRAAVGRARDRAAGSPSRCAGRAIRGVYALYRRADAIEQGSGRPSWLGARVDALSGRG